MQTVAMDVKSWLYQKLLIGLTPWVSRSGRRPRIVIVYPDSALKKMAGITLSIATHLFVALLAFWVGSNPSANHELTARVTSLWSQSLTRKVDGLPARASRNDDHVEPVEELIASWIDMKVDGLEISRAQFTRLPSTENKLAYDLTLVNRGRRFIGNLEVKISGTLGGRSVVHSHAGFSESDSRDRSSFMNVSSFLQTGGEIALPEKFTPKVVFVKLVEHGEIRASKAVWMHEDTRIAQQ